MILIVCIDDKGGMAFNKRRQTRDKVQRVHLNKLVCGNIYMSPASAKLYADDLTDGKCIADPHFLETAGADDYALSETHGVDKYIEKAQKIILYKWNRSYPSDVRFPMEALENYKPEKTESFKGSSHDTITCEVYVR